MNIEENKSLNDKANLAINKLKKRSSFIRYAKRNYGLYLMLISGLVYLFIFHYIPMYGIVLAFKDFDMFAGENPFISIIKSPWVGLKVFKDVFSRPDFYNVFRNTLIISTYKIFFL
ncbi:MAG TPA: hypothetical protein DD426_10065 [Clostridiaceae bacterium]|nr:hypothetical protein [Clostridiaceae bacterium]